MSTPSTGRPCRCDGFTIIELLVAIMLLGLLMAIGLPAMTDTIRNNLAVEQANRLVMALNTARSEASKRGLAVTICAANTAQTKCDGDAVSDWTKGWLIFTDQAGTAGTLDTADGDVVLQRAERVADGILLSSNSIGFLRYGRGGAPTNSASITIGTAAITFGLKHKACKDSQRRVISVDRTGRANLTKTTCS